MAEDFRAAVPFWGQSTQILSNFPPKRDYGPNRVKGMPSWKVVEKLLGPDGFPAELL